MPLPGAAALWIGLSLAVVMTRRRRRRRRRFRGAAVDRRPFYTVKHELCPDGCISMWVADMDLAVAPAIHDAIVVACLFNFMNRFVSTLGIEADEVYLAAAGPRLRDEGYASSLNKTMGKVG